MFTINMDFFNHHLKPTENREEKLSNLKFLYKRKSQLFKKISSVKTKKSIQKYNDKITELEYAIQEAWGFPKDSTYHRFWETPHCTCPAYDNIDAYPHLQYYNCNCILHGV
jgi:hypothetical protein